MHNQQQASSSQSDDALQKFVFSPQVLTDAHISPLLNKMLKSHSFATVTNAFKNLLTYQLAADGKSITTANLNTLDLKAIFNEELLTFYLTKEANNSPAQNVTITTMPNSNGLQTSALADLDIKDNRIENDSSDNEQQSGEIFYSNTNLDKFMSHYAQQQLHFYAKQKQPAQPHQQQQQLQQQHHTLLNQQQLNQKPVNYQDYQDLMVQSINQMNDRLNDKSNLRPVVIDGNDVGLLGSRQTITFSFVRLRTAVAFFEQRGNPVYVILPNWRKDQLMASSPIINSEMEALADLESKGVVHMTPSKRLGPRHIKCDDDLTILSFAVKKEGVILSNDNFKRFLNYSDDYKNIIEERVLMYSFIDDMFMPAMDPLGKGGPSLDNFLRFESVTNNQYMKRCPYKKRCTYGVKCKYWHPERGDPTSMNGLLASSSNSHSSYMTKPHAEISPTQATTSTIFPGGGYKHFPPSNNQQYNDKFLMNHMSEQTELRAMGPASTKHSNKFTTQQQNLAIAIDKMSLQTQANSNWPEFQAPIEPSTKLYNLTGVSKLSSPSSVPAASSVSPQQSSTLIRNVSSKENKNSSFPELVAVESGGFKSADGEMPKKSKNLSPNSIRQRLTKILDQDQVETFLVKYKDIKDESDLIFIAQCMKFDSCLGF